MNKEVKLAKKDYRHYILLALIVLVMIYGFVDYFNNSKAIDNQIVETDTNKQTDKSNNTSDSKQSATDKKDTKESDKDKTTTNQTENKDNNSQTNKPASNTGNTNTGKTNNTNTNNNSNNNGTGSSSGNSQPSGHWEERQVLVKEAWTEQVLVQKGACEDVVVQAAWDEEVWEPGAWYGADEKRVKVCNQCGYTVDESESMSSHLSESETCGGWHSDVIAISDPYWHGNKTVVHHDAVYQTVCQPDKYETIYHEAEYRTERVWVND